MRWMLVLALTVVFAASAAAERITAYSAPVGTAIHEAPRKGSRVVHRVRSIDVLYRAAISRKVGDRVFKKPTDGAPVCKNGWCDVCIPGGGGCGFVPASQVTRHTFESDLDCDPWENPEC